MLNFPHHSQEMTTATWQTVGTWPSRCPNSLGAPVFHGTWFFFLFVILSPHKDLVPLETAEKCGVCNYPARRSPVTGDGGAKRIKRKMSNENSRLKLPQTYLMESRSAYLFPLFLHFQLKVNSFMSTDLQNNVGEKLCDNISNLRPVHSRAIDG